MKFLALPGAVSYPLMLTLDDDLGFDVYIGPYDILDDGFMGLNGNLYMAMRRGSYIGARLVWIVAKHHVWVWERRSWLGGGTIGVLDVGSTPDALVRPLVFGMGRSDVRIVNFLTIDELVEEYKKGHLDAVALPLASMHKVGVEPDYPLDSLYEEVLGIRMPGDCGIAVRDEGINKVMRAYELGISRLGERGSAELLFNFMKNELKMDVDMNSVELTIKRVKYSLSNADDFNEILDLVRKSYSNIKDEWEEIRSLLRGVDNSSTQEGN